MSAFIRCIAAFAATAFVTSVVPAMAGDLLGRLDYLVVQEGDTLTAIAQHKGIGYVELLAANPGVDPWLPRVGKKLLLPTAHLLPDAPRRGIVVNLGDLRLYHFPKDGGPARSFPLGIGRKGWETPVGETEVLRKRPNPTWTPPPSIRAEHPQLPACIGPGPSNPLGDFALDLKRRGYVIHGTNKPAGVGRRVSHGCIRMYPKHIAELFDLVEVGTPVTIIEQPLKLGRVGQDVYLEVHPSKEQVDELEAGATTTVTPLPDLRDRVLKAAGPDSGRIDWSMVYEAARRRLGVPIRITR